MPDKSSSQTPRRQSQDRPYTPGELARDLLELGLGPGKLVMVHCSLAALGSILGGPAGVYAALAAASNCDGTKAAHARGSMLMPAFDSDNSEPSHWKDPPLAAKHWPLIRAERPPFDPECSPSLKMGALAEHFRTLPGTLRSAHPHVSWCGRGPLAGGLLANHPLDYPLGEDSPLGRAYAADGWVLSLGTRATTVLHLAEHRCDWAGKRVIRQGSAMLVQGERRWVEYDMLSDENSDFEALRQDYMAAHSEDRGSLWQEGRFAGGSARLFAIRPLVDFAAPWLAQHRV